MDGSLWLSITSFVSVFFSDALMIRSFFRRETTKLLWTWICTDKNIKISMKGDKHLLSTRHLFIKIRQQNLLKSHFLKIFSFHTLSEKYLEFLRGCWCPEFQFVDIYCLSSDWWHIAIIPWQEATQQSLPAHQRFLTNPS